METRRLITAIVLSLLVWFVIQGISHRFYPPAPQPEIDAPPVTTTTPTAELPPAFGTETPPAIGQTPPDARVAESDERVDDIVLGSSERGNGFRMRTVFTNHGASLVSAQLSDYAAQVSDPEHRGYQLVLPIEYPSEQTRHSLATHEIILVDETDKEIPVDLKSARWFHKVDQQTGRMQVTFWLDVQDENRPLARIYKTYQLQKDSYDLDLSVRVENLSDQTLTAHVLQEGIVGIPQEDARYEDRKIFSGVIQEGRTGVRVTSIDRKDLIKSADTSRRLGSMVEQAVWAGQANKYFAALMAAVDRDGNLSGEKIESVNARTYTGNPDLGEDLSTLWTSQPLQIAPAEQQSVDFEVYLGPKSDEVFFQGKYLERNYAGTFEYSWCTFQWLADLMAWLLMIFFTVSRNYGIAIILLVLVVRIALHPITKTSQISMMRMQRDMQRLQPKLKTLKEKHKDNREALNKATMELYKEEGINPAGQILGCLPMLLQLPIWVALWSALNNTFALRHQPFVLWIRDLSAPDALIRFAEPVSIPLISGLMGPIHELNILPLLLMASMFLQQKFNPASAPTPDADPVQAKQQKMIFYFMAIFMGFIFYNAPSGLNLYILTSTLIGVLETRRIRKQLKEEENRPPQPKKVKPDSLWGKLQKRVEEYAKEYERGKEIGKSKKPKK